MNEVIRNKGRITRMLLLLEMATNSPKEQKTLADSVGITPQAVSDYISKMECEGLVRTGPDGPRPTVGGVERLSHDLLVLKEMIDSSIGRLDIIRSTDAVACGRIEKGARVFLSMKNGMLCASAEGEGSSGIAERDAADGEMIPISSLEGLTDMERGRIHLVEITPVRSGGGKGIMDMDRLSASLGLCKSNLRTVSLDLEAQSLFCRSSLKPDMEMPPPEGVVEPTYRGLDVLAIGTPYSISGMVRFMGGSKTDHVVKRNRIFPEQGES